MSFSALIRRSLATAALLTAAALAHAQEPAAVQVQVQVKDFDVYVDLPTAFAFIKLPSGWKFIGKLDTEQLRHLPPGTLTALLKADEAASPVRLAAAGRTVPASVLK